MTQRTGPIGPLSWRSLQTRLTVLILLVFLACIWSLSLFVGGRLQADLKQLVGQQQLDAVTLHASEINRNLEERIQLLERVSGLMPEALIQQPEALQEFLEVRPALSHVFNGGLFVTNAASLGVAGVPASIDRRGFDFSGFEHVQLALRRGQTNVSRPFIGRNLKSPVFSIATPVRDRRGRIVGSLVGVTDLAQRNFLDPLVSAHPGSGNRYLLLANTWRLIISTGANAQAAQPLPGAGVNPGIDRWMTGFEGSQVMPDPAGQTVLASSRRIAAANWTLVALLPIEQVLAPARQMVASLVSATLAASLLAAALAWWLLHHQLRPLHLASEALRRQMSSRQPLQALPQAGHDEVGQLIGAFNAVLDVASQREAALQSAQQTSAELARQLEDAQQLAQMGSWKLVFPSQRLSWSGQIYRLFELDPQRFAATYEALLDAIHPEDRQAVNAAYQASLSQRSSYTIEHRLLMKDGRIKWVQERGVTEFDAAGQPLRSLGTVQDITERRRAQEALEQAHQLLMQVIDTLPMRVFWKDVHLNYLGCNAAFARDANRASPQEMVGCDDYQMTWVAQADLYRADDRQVMDSGVPRLFFEEPQTAPDGQTLWLRTSKIPLKTAAGKVFGVLGMYEDITARKSAEDELGQYRQRLEQMVQERTRELEAARLQAESANRSKSEFLANMSHEIRTPMNGVIGMLDILEHTPLGAEQRRMLATVQSSSMALLSLLNDILDFSKIEAGRLDVESVPSHLRDIVEGTALLMHQLARSRGVKLSVYCDPALPEWVLTDPTRLRQIITNLLGNALKFVTHHQGQAMLTVLPLNQPDGSPWLLLRVIDNGIGMPPEVLDKLFQPFTQAEASTNRRFGGTGLGLSITQRLVHLLGGRILVQSTPHVGSVFTVELPLQACAPAPGAAAPSLAGLSDLPDVRGVRALLVLSDLGCLTTLQSYLGAAGVQVQALPDAASARRELAAAGPRCVCLLGPELAPPAAADDPGATGAAWTDDPRVLWLRPRGPQEAAPHQAVVPTNPLIYRELLLAVAQAVRPAAAVRPDRLASPARPALTSPAGAPDLPGDATPQASSPPGAGRPWVLVAEDNETNRDVLQQQLRLLGYASEAAEDGEQALALWQSGRFALLLTDCHMPRMDGYALTEAIRRSEAPGQRLPIIAITANAMPGQADYCLGRGMDGYLSKPLRMNDLAQALARWLPQAAAPTPQAIQATQPTPDGGAGTETPADPQEDSKNRASSPFKSRAEGQFDVWDERALRERVSDDVGIRRRLLRRFLGNAQAQSHSIAQAAAQADIDGLCLQAHTLKSAARTVGAMALGELCQTLENACHARDLPACRQAAQALPEALAQAGALIQNHLTALATLTPEPPDA